VILAPAASAAGAAETRLSGASTMRGARLWLALLLGLSAPLRAQEVAPPGSTQEDPRARAIREAYEEQLRRERQVVSMDFKNAPVDQIIEEFRRQGGINIDVDRRNFPEPFVIDEFKVVNEPLMRALQAFSDKSEIAMESLSSSLVRLSRPPRVTFNFRDADVKVVIDMIARVSGANLVIAPEVKGFITLSINNVPWNEVLSVVVKTLGFTTVKENFGIIRVIHPQELLKQMETQVFRLKYIQPPPIYAAKMEEGKFISGRPIQPPTQIEEILKRFVLKQVLETVLSKDAGGRAIGRLDFDPQSLTFVVTDTKVVLARIEEIIQLLDVEPRQVLIDIKFVSTTNEDLLTFGMSWNFGGEEGAGIRNTVLDPSSFVDPTGATRTGKITKLPFGFGKEVGTPGDQYFLSEFDMIMTFRAFKQDKFSRLIQEPTLAVVDNMEATIFVGETISYAETKASSNQYGGLEYSIGEASKSPVKVGFQLFIVPKIVQETNKVILTVIPQNEFLSGTTSPLPGFERFILAGAGSGGSTASIDLPRVSTNTILTKLLLESGKTAVLGGLVVERSNYLDSGIPILKDIPLVNYLFKQRSDTIRKEHLLVFITPRIVRSGSGPSDQLKEMLRQREETERREFEQMRGKRSAKPAEAPKTGAPK
jgi:type IV pilus assembly protein PilQ